MQEHHMTQYIYPSLVGQELSALRLQTPLHASQRYRPKGGSEIDLEFVTITNKRKDPPTTKQFNVWVVAEGKKDHTSENPLGRAMRRVTGFQGNTILRMGKFELEGRMTLIIQRKTLIALSDGRSGMDEATYEIPVEQWKYMHVQAWPGHDSWWRRLTDLLTCSSDRAFLHVQYQVMFKLDTGLPYFEWAQRPDVATSFNEEINWAALETNNECPLCQYEYNGDKGGEGPVKLPKCKEHYMCVECLESLLDSDAALQKKYIECPLDRKEQPITIPRTRIIIPSEIDYWRWRFMEKDLVEFDEPLNWVAVSVVGHPDIADKSIWLVPNMAVDYLFKILVYIASIFPYGHTMDNPVWFKESKALHDALVQQIQALARHKVSLEHILKALQTAAEGAVKPVRRNDGALGNQEFPPNFVRYRDRLVPRLARGCFLTPARLHGLQKKIEVDRRTFPGKNGN